MFAKKYNCMKPIDELANDFLSQSTIAVVGISSTKQTVANGVYKRLKIGKRTVFAVGKNTALYDSDPCYPDLASIPARVDGVFVAANPENIERVIDECVSLTIQRVWIHNFNGVMKLSDTTAKKCREHNITVIPGACPMMFGIDADVGHKCIKWFLSITGKLRTE
jgi:predicted CoA-binding protein